MSKYNLTDIFEQYRIGSGYTRDFDYAGMLKAGLETGVDTDIEILRKMSDDFEDVNYHRENNHLQMAIDALEEGAIKEASMFFGDFHAEIKSTMETFDMEIPDTLGGFMDSYIKEDAKAVDLAIEASQEKAGINEVRIDREVANRIEGFLNIPMKAKFLDAWEDLFYDLVDDEPFFVDDVIAHLSNEMFKRINGNQVAGDRLAGIPEGDSIEEAKYTLDSISQDEYGKNYDDLDPEQQRYMRSELEITKGYPFSAGIDQDGYRLPEFPDPMKNMKEDKGVDFIRALKVDANGTSLEIKSYLESLKRSGDKFDSVDDYVEDFKNYVADKALQEHFNRFK